MNKEILEKTSFGILRTNPKLTSNVKIVADSNDVVYLESFDANQELSKSKYKGFKVSSNSDYYFDLYRFYNQSGKVNNEVAFELFEKDSGLSIKDKYGLQFDTTYGYGAAANPSAIYDEEFSLFAPLWIEPSNIPDYFIICRIEDPVSVSSKTLANENDPTFLESVIDPQNFITNYLDKATIISTFDLTDESNVGRYIRRHASNPEFPESALLADWEKEQYFQYNGININRPGFVSEKKDLFYDTWPNDVAIIEYENKITNGFSQLGVVHPNILNMQFLFNDDSVTDYRFQRYFGLYVNKAQYNEFFIDGDALFQDRFNQIEQLPIPTQNVIGYKDNILDQEQTNPTGIVLYAEQPLISSLQGSTFFPNEITFERARIGYVQDASGEFHKIKNNSQFDPNTIKLDDTSINWKNFSGFQNPENYVPAEFNLGVKGRPAIVIEFVKVPIDDDEFRIFFTDTTDPAQLPFIDFFTMTASQTIPPGTHSSNLYSTQGSMTDIATAFANCVNGTEVYYPDLLSIGAVSIGSKVIIFSRVASETWNKIKVTSFAQATLAEDIGLRFVSGQDTEYTTLGYQSSPQPFTPVVGFLATGHFRGGCDNTKAKVKVSSNTTDLFSTDKYMFTSKKYTKIGEIIPYIDEPVFDRNGYIIGFENFEDNYTIVLEDTSADITLTSSQQCTIIPLRFNNCGLFSIYPIKDFDFDFYNLQYNKDADSNVQKLINWYTTGLSGPYGQTSSFVNTYVGPSPQPPNTLPSTWVNTIIGSTSPFIQNGGFQNLAGIGNELDDTDSIVYNEYDRLKENEMKQLALDSRVVPFINKWVYDDDGLDVRQNPYRLDASAAFGYPNFGPSHREFITNAKFYTHEWYYLQQYPPYMNFEERRNSYSYFETPINIGSTFTVTGTTADYGLATVSGPTGIDLDYFKEYFTRETIGGTAVTQQVKYSTFAYATSERFAETFFRGAKVVVKERVDNSDINFDIDKKKLRKSTKYNDYKFAAIIQMTPSGLSFEVVENEEFKTITLLIKAGLMDNYFTKFGSAPTDSTDPSDYFIDRSIIYTLKDRLEIDGTGAYQYADFNIGGAIHYWVQDPSGTGYIVYGIQNFLTGSFPNFIGELSQAEDGTYNDINVPHPNDPNQIIKFSGVSNPGLNTFQCQAIEAYTIVPPAFSLNVGPIWADPNWQFITNIFSNTKLWSMIPSYELGGFNSYTGTIEDITFAYIADIFNSGSPNVEYTTYKSDGSVVNNDKVLELTMPIEGIKANYLKPVEDMNVPNELDSILSGDVSGYQMGAMDRAVINIMSRYNGRYQPKFNDILYFKDYYESGTTNVRGTRYYGFGNYMNLEFNLDEDKFGTIDNYFYNKVNPENPSGVLRLGSDNKLPSVYPKIGEIAIDKRDMYTFLSNWDVDYYRKALNRTTEESIVGYRGVIENKAFLGSKIISIPDEIRLENFELLELTDIVGGISNIDNYTGSAVVSFVDTTKKRPVRKKKKSLSTEDIREDKRTTKQNLVLDVFTTKALTKYLRADGFDYEFNTWINPNFSFGESGLDDDIEAYIQANIFQRYKVKRIIFYENRFANNVNTLEPIEVDLTNLELLQKGYMISENVQIKFSTESPLNFKLIYNIPKLDNYSISFKVDLEKK